MLLFVVVGNFILEIKGMWLEYWLVLFSLSCFANLLGLNISASFNSVKVIYILIPILIIPQLLFSGVIVKFDKLHPLFGNESAVPTIGNVMASRWAYEALAVTQFKKNDFEKRYFNLEQNKSIATWKKDYWLQELSASLDFVKMNLDNPEKINEVNATFILLTNEITKEQQYIQNAKCNHCIEEFSVAKFSDETYARTKDFIALLKNHYKSIVDKNRALIDQKTKAYIEEHGKENYLKLVEENTNDALTQFVTNKTDLTKLVNENNHLIQKSDPIYLDPWDKSFLASHFYAPKKKLFGIYVDTLWANLLVIWLMTLILSITLYLDVLKKILDGLAKLFSRASSIKKV
jgi:hypothetical protein